jgi:hypothetical protein
MTGICKSGVLLLALIVLFALAGSAPAQARPGQCTQYVAAKRSLTGYPNAYQWANGYLASKGFRRVATPVAGAIVVYQPGVNGTNATYGHVAIVEYVWGPDAAGRIYFPIRGANQGASNVVHYARYFTDGGYSNVSVRASSMLPGQWGISFWVR